MGKANTRKTQATIENFTIPRPPGARSTAEGEVEATTEMAQGGPASDGGTVDLAALIREGNKALAEKIDAVATSVQLIRQDMEKLRTRTAEVEAVTAELKVASSTQPKDLGDLTAATKRHAAKLSDLEDRLRRNNVRLIGLQERTETGPMETFLESFLPGLFDKQVFDATMCVDRAHRVPSLRRPPGSSPRVIMIRFLYYRDKLKLLQAARDKGEINYEGSRLSFYPDFSPGTQAKRRAFDAAKKILREKGIRYALVGTATLRVDAKDKRHYLDSPDEALQFAEKA